MDSTGYPAYISWLSYGTSYIGTILENLQVSRLFNTKDGNAIDRGWVASTGYPAYSSWLSYGTSYIGTILENLQVSRLFNTKDGNAID